MVCRSELGRKSRVAAAASYYQALGKKQSGRNGKRYVEAAKATYNSILGDEMEMPPAPPPAPSPPAPSSEVEQAPAAESAGEVSLSGLMAMVRAVKLAKGY